VPVTQCPNIYKLAVRGAKKNSSFWELVLGFGLSVSLARQVPYHLSLTSSPFCAGYFGDGVWLLLRLVWIMILLFTLPINDGIASAHYYAHFFFKMELAIFFAQTVLEL
jgi:hypothetical protein